MLMSFAKSFEYNLKFVEIALSLEYNIKKNYEGIAGIYVPLNLKKAGRLFVLLSLCACLEVIRYRVGSTNFLFQKFSKVQVFQI
jgi:hypothetical protein